MSDTLVHPLVVPPIDAVGTLLTVTACDADAVQPLSVAVTVYVPLVVKVLAAADGVLPPDQT